MDMTLTVEESADRRQGLPVLKAVGIKKYFDVRGGALHRLVGKVHAVDGVDLEVYPGETVGVVGESGCGKSTLSRTLVKLIEPTEGEIWFGGQDITRFGSRAMREIRRDMQIVFQDPYSSLDPRMSIGDIVREPFLYHDAPGQGSDRERVARLLETVGLPASLSASRPRQLSGGQRQRVGIARALALNPKLIVLDEPVSALDVSIRAQVVNLLRSLREEFGLSYLFVAHDLSLVRHVCDRIAAMYLGKVVEIGSRSAIYEAALHPYTQALLSAAPVPEPSKKSGRDRIVLTGDVPSPVNPPSGCRFRTRCWKAQAVCAEEEPLLVDRGLGHPVACHFPERVGSAAVGSPAAGRD